MASHPSAEIVLGDQSHPEAAPPLAEDPLTRDAFRRKPIPAVAGWLGRTGADGSCPAPSLRPTRRVHFRSGARREQRCRSVLPPERAGPDESRRGLALPRPKGSRHRAAREVRGWRVGRDRRDLEGHHRQCGGGCELRLPCWANWRNAFSMVLRNDAGSTPVVAELFARRRVSGSAHQNPGWSERVRRLYFLRISLSCGRRSFFVASAGILAATLPAGGPPAPRRGAVADRDDLTAGVAGGFSGRRRSGRTPPPTSEHTLAAQLVNLSRVLPATISKHFLHVHPMFSRAGLTLLRRACENGRFEAWNRLERPGGRARRFVGTPQSITAPDRGALRTVSLLRSGVSGAETGRLSVLPRSRRQPSRQSGG